MNSVTFFTRIKCTLVLLLLMVVDIGPVPVTAMIGLFIIVFRPLWFKDLIGHIYSEDTAAETERENDR